MVGDPSSKYAYNPNQLDVDITNKNEVFNIMLDKKYNDMVQFINTQVLYADGSVMSRKTKFNILKQSLFMINDNDIV